MKTMAEIYAALEANEDFKGLVGDIKGNMGTLNDEAKTKRLAAEGSKAELAELKDTMKTMTAAIAKIQGVENPETAKPGDIDVNIMNRKLQEMTEIQEKLTATMADLETSKKTNLDLEKISALTNASKDKINPSAFDDFIALHKDGIIKSSDGQWQTEDGIAIDKYVENSLEKRSYFKSNPIATATIVGVDSINTPAKEMSDVEKFNAKVSEIQALV